MSTYTTEGVVLRRVDYGEADRVLTVLTPDHGKVGVIARGVRRPASRLAAHTDLFAQSRMQLARGRGELEVLTQAQALGPSAPPHDARRAAYAAVCAELADRVLESGSPDAEMYGLVTGALRDCADLAREPRAALAWLTRRMIDRLGYGPQLFECAGCATPLPEAEAAFSAAAGGLLCARCSTSDPAGVPCSVRVIKVLRIAASGDLDLYHRLRLDEASLATLEAVAERELAHHLERQLRSLTVLHAIERR